MGAATAPGNPIPSDDLAGVVLAAGAGTRLAPLSDLLPKALCPVGNAPLVDLALERIRAVAGATAVNAHHLATALARHLDRTWDGEIEVSVEEGEALGTAGGVANLRDWIDGRPVVVVNADAWSPTPLAPLIEDWDGRTVRVMVHGETGFGPRARIVASTLPWSVVRDLPVRPTGLYERVWRAAFEHGELEVVAHEGPFVDCGTPAQYLEANLRAVGLRGGSIIAPDAEIEPGVDIRASVVGPGARVRADLVESVVWAGQSVEPDLPLIRSIRAGTSVTVGPV